MGKIQTSKKLRKSSKNTLKAKAAVTKPRFKAGGPAYDDSAAAELSNR